MDWIQIGTFIIALGGLLKQFYESNFKQRQIEKDRLIAVTVDERRRMQQALFDNVTAILSIDRQTEDLYLSEKEVKKHFNDVLNRKIKIWINLNRDNQYYKDMRHECNFLATLLAGYLEYPTKETRLNYLSSTAETRQRIWILIDKYIEEEETLIKKMLYA